MQDASGTRQVITVLGMHRSGTSLCANVLQGLGVNMADQPGASPNNRRGHWERPRINDLNDQVFLRFGRGWSDASHILALPEFWLDDPRVQAIKAGLIAHLSEALQRDAAPFGFKDPRTARLLPLWREVFAAAGVTPRFVFCLRNPAQVARSVSARDRMAGEQAEYRWLQYNADAVRGAGGAEICLVPYEDWFTCPQHVVRRIAAFIGAPEPAAGFAASIVDADLRHDDADAPPARPLARKLHGMILNGVVQSGGRATFSAPLREFCALIGDIENQLQPLLVEREVLRASVADQNRVIGDLNAVIRDLRRSAA